METPENAKQRQRMTWARKSGKVLETAVPPFEGRVVEYAPRVSNDRGSYLDQETGTRYSAQQIRIRRCAEPVWAVFSSETQAPSPCAMDAGHEGEHSEVRRIKPYQVRHITIDPRPIEPDEVVVERLADGQGPANVSTLEVRRAVIKLTLRGLSAKKIARRIGCHERTVTRHRVTAREEGALV